MTLKRAAGVLSFSLVLSLSTAAYAEELPEYVPSQLSNGHLTSVGSDSMDELVAEWVKIYAKFQPAVTTQVASFGSASAPPALIEGTANLGHMARPMKGTELEDFKLRYGFEPTQIQAALVGVTLYVSVKNPIDQISFDDLDAIYSATRTRSAGREATTWGALGVKGNLSSEPIMQLGVGPDSQPNTYFKQQVLLQGEFVSSLQTTADTESLIEAVKANENAIGFGNYVQLTPEEKKAVKILAVTKDKSPAQRPSVASIQNGSYPLSRALNLYFVRTPNRPVDPAVRDFLTFALSKQGQTIVAREGLIPLSAEIAKGELAKLR